MVMMNEGIIFLSGLEI